MLLNRIRPEVDKILRKNQNGFRTNRSTTGQILTVRRIIEGANEKNLTATLLFIDFSKTFDSIHRGNMAEILKAYRIPEKIINEIMIAYKYTKSIERSDDGDTELITITGGVLQGDILAPFLFITCLDYSHIYVLKMSLDRDNVLGFTLSERNSRRYPAIKMTDVDYADDLAIVTDKTSEATIILHKIENTAKEIGLNINSSKTEFISINQGENEKMKSLNGKDIKKVSDFKYLGSNIQSIEKDMNIRLAKSWAALNNMNAIRKYRLPDRIKRNFFRTTVESVLVYGSVSWTLTKALEKRISGNYTRMLRAIRNRSWKDHPSNKEIYSNIPDICTSIRQQILRFSGHCWRNKCELASDIILWQPTKSERKIRRPRRTYVDQLMDDTLCNVNELKTAMDDNDAWKKRVKNCRASSTC